MSAQNEMNLREACVAGAVRRVTCLLHNMSAADVDKFYVGVGDPQTALFSAVVAHCSEFHSDNRHNVQLCINALLKKGARVTKFGNYYAECDEDDNSTPAGYVRLKGCRKLLEQVSQRNVAPLPCAIPNRASLEATLQNHAQHDSEFLVQAAIHAMGKNYTHDEGVWLEQQLLVVALRSVGLVKPASVSILPVCVFCPHKHHREKGADVRSLSNILSHYDGSNQNFARHMRGPHQPLKRQILVAIRYRRERYRAANVHSSVHTSPAVSHAQYDRNLKLSKMRGNILQNSKHFYKHEEAKVYEEKLCLFMDSWLLPEPEGREVTIRPFLTCPIPPGMRMLDGRLQAYVRSVTVHYDDDTQCPICQTELRTGFHSGDEVLVLDCGHVYCSSCFHAQLYRGRGGATFNRYFQVDCALCRAPAIVWSSFAVEDGTLTLPQQVARSSPLPTKIYSRVLELGELMYTYFYECPLVQEAVTKHSLNIAVQSPNAYRQTWAKQSKYHHAGTKLDVVLTQMKVEMQDELDQRTCRAQDSIVQFKDILAACLTGHVEMVKSLLRHVPLDDVHTVHDLLVPDESQEAIVKFYSTSASSSCDDGKLGLLPFFALEAFHKGQSLSERRKPSTKHSMDVLRCVAICVGCFPGCLEMQCLIGPHDLVFPSVTITCYLEKVLRAAACRTTFFNMLGSAVDIPWLTQLMNESVCSKPRGETDTVVADNAATDNAASDNAATDNAAADNVAADNAANIAANIAADNADTATNIVAHTAAADIAADTKAEIEGHGQKGEMQCDDNQCSSSTTSSSGVRACADSDMQVQGESGTLANKKHKPVLVQATASQRPPVYKNHAMGVTTDGKIWETQLQARPGYVPMPGRCYPDPHSYFTIRVERPTMTKDSTCENVLPKAVPKAVSREGDHAHVQKLLERGARAMQGCSATHTTTPQPEGQTDLPRPLVVYLESFCSSTWRTKIIEHLFWEGLPLRRSRGKRGRGKPPQKSPLTMSRDWVHNYSPQANTGPWAPRWFHEGWVKTISLQTSGDEYQCKHAPGVWCETVGCNEDTEPLEIKDLNLFQDIRALATHMINSPQLCTTLLCLMTAPKKFDAFYFKSYKQTLTKIDGVTNVTKQSTPSVDQALFNLLYDHDCPVDLKLLEFLVMQARLYRTLWQDTHTECRTLDGRTLKCAGPSTWSFIDNLWKKHYIRPLKSSNVMVSRPTPTRNTMGKGLSSCNLGDGPPTMCLDVGTTVTQKANRKRRNEDALRLCLDECDPPKLELVGDESTLCSPSCEEEGVHVGVQEDVQAIQGTEQCKDVGTVLHVTWTE